MAVQQPDNSVIVVVLGPAVILAVLGALGYWLRSRGRSSSRRHDPPDE